MVYSDSIGWFVVRVKVTKRYIEYISVDGVEVLLKPIRDVAVLHAGWGIEVLWEGVGSGRGVECEVTGLRRRVRLLWEWC